MRDIICYRFRSTLPKLINGPGPLHVTFSKGYIPNEETTNQTFIAGYTKAITDRSLKVKKIDGVVRALNKIFTGLESDTNASRLPTSEPSIILATCVGVQERSLHVDELNIIRGNLVKFLYREHTDAFSLDRCACTIGLDLISNSKRWGLECGFLPAYAIVVCLVAAMRGEFDMRRSVTHHIDHMLEQLKKEASADLTVKDFTMKTCQIWDIALEKVVKRSWLDYRMEPDVRNAANEIISNEDRLKNLSLLISICIHREAVLRAAWECVLRALFQLPHNAGISESTQINLISCLVPYMDPHEMPNETEALDRCPAVDRYALQWWRYQNLARHGSSATEQDVQHMHQAVDEFINETINTSRRALEAILQDFEPVPQPLRSRRRRRRRRKGEQIGSRSKDAPPEAQQEDEKDEEDEEDECVVCMLPKPRIMFLPCRHQVVCVTCNDKLCERNPDYTCPMCRTTIASTFQPISG